MTLVFDLGGFQRLIPDQLSHPGFDAVQAAENLHRTLDAGCLPTGDRLQFGQHLVEALPKIEQNMIGVGRKAVVRIHCRSGPPHENGSGNMRCRWAAAASTRSQSGKVSFGIMPPKMIPLGIRVGDMRLANANIFSTRQGR